MFEKVNPCHTDKVADRIAGALVDLAYKKAENPRIAVEVLIGHGMCYIIAEASVSIPIEEITAAVHRIAGNLAVDYVEVPQDGHLADNQANGVRCGDNGIFKGNAFDGMNLAIVNMDIVNLEHHGVTLPSCRDRLR